MTRKAAWVVVAYAFLAVIVLPVFPHFVSPNEFTRWATAAAIFEGHTFEVTPLLALLGPNVEDLSLVNGHYYSNKAPGGAIAGLPAYALARLFVGPPSAANVRTTLSAMRLLSATLPVLLLAVLFVRIANRLGASQTTTALFVLLFATPLFAYGLLDFSHALAAFALFAAWALLFVDSSARGDVLAGALIGIAVVSEYPALIAGAVLIAFAPGIRSMLRIAVGGLPFAIALAIYNRMIFGGFFTLSSGFERDPAFRQLAKRGLFGIGLPDPVNMAHLLFDPSKGLLIFSPILLAGFVAIPRVRSALTPRQFWSLTMTPLAIFLTYAGYPNWHGGWTVGARYLVPALPFLAMLVAFATATWAESFLIGASVAAVSLTSLVWPFVPPSVPAPWSTYALPLLRDGLVAPNLFHLIGRPLAIAVPFAVVFAVLMIVVDRRAIAIAGAALCIALGAAVEVKPIVTVGRAYIEQVSFEQEGALARATPPGMTINPGFYRRAEAARTLPPTSWPF